jgi:EmrB/QacA subfamily drug resistance transporter
MTSQQRWTLAATILGSAMAFIDMTVINVALPVMQTELRAGVDDAQWIVDSYLLVLSALILAGGSLGDRLGRVRVFGFGVLTFAAASLWCGAAPGANALIAARALQGVGAALLVPGSLAIINETFPRDQRGRAIGTWSALTSLAVIAGPLLGGFLVQSFSWRAVFYINAPIAAVVLWAVWRHVPASKHVHAGAIDWLGTLLVTLGLGAVTYALIEHMPYIAIAGVAALIAFVFVQGRVANPIVPLKLFRSRSFTAANVLTLLLYAALSAATFLLPFNLIQVQGYSPAQAGAAFLPFVATMTLLSRWTGALADRIGARLPLIVGPLVAAAGFALLAYPSVGGSYWTTFFPGVLVLGIGMSITVAPLTTTVMTSIEDERYSGAASGINNAIARAAGLLAIAAFGVVAVFVFERQLEHHLRDAPAEVRQAMRAEAIKLADARPPAGVDAATKARVEQAVKRSFVSAFRTDVLAAALLAALSAFGGAMVRGRDDHAGGDGLQGEQHHR